MPNGETYESSNDDNYTVYNCSNKVQDDELPAIHGKHHNHNCIIHGAVATAAAAAAAIRVILTNVLTMMAIVIVLVMVVSLLSLGSRIASHSKHCR